MADIVDPIVIKFNNERIRIMAEAVRDLKVIIDDAAENYVDEIAPLIAGNVDGDLIDDKREAQGVSRMIKSDMTDFITVLNSIKTTLDAAGVMDTVRKPCVRPLRVR